MRNTNKTINEAFISLVEINKIVSGSQKKLVVYLSMCFGNPYGEVWNLDIIDKSINLIRTSRGGKITWHGPGQRVVYLMLNLKNRLQDVKAYVYALEELIILTLKDFYINGVRINGQPGVWVKDNNGYDKIAALGIRISSWITFHGISINVNPNLDEFNNIVPCGIKNSGVTSFHKLGKKIALRELDISLKKNFNKVFGNEGLFKLK